MEFHIGDEVCVLYQGKYTPGRVLGVNKVEGKNLYMVSPPGTWYAEDRLDYDFQPAQKEWRERMERRVHALNLAAEEVRGIIAEGIDLKMPSSVLTWLSRQLKESRSKIEP